MAEGAAAPAGRGLLVRGLAHRFGARTVVDHVELALAPGEVHCLVGPSGCGKTTTLRLLAGLEPLQQGRIELNGRLLAAPGRSLPPERRRVGLMFQEVSLFPHLRVGENVAFALAARGRRRHAGQVEALLAAVGMAAAAASWPRTLSGGEQQRVALARALAAEPELMLLDEAFTALDTGLRLQVRAEALAVLRRAGVPTLLVTHDPGEAIEAADRIHAMRAGRIVQSGTPAELYARPVDPLVAGFFGPVLRLSARVAAGRASSPLGSIAAPGMAEGSTVQTILRAEAVRLRRADGPVRGRVLGRRDLGPVEVLHLGLADGSSIELRRAAADDVAVGEELAIELDPRHLFVYAAGG